MNYGVARAFGVQAFDSLNLHSAPCGFCNVAIGAGPEVDLDRAVGNDAVLPRSYMILGEAKLGREELGTSLDIKRCKNGCCGNELGSCTHSVRSNA